MALPDNLRAFDDMGTARKWLKEDALSALQKRFPVDDDEYSLQLDNVHTEGPESFGLARQKQALLKDEQLRVPVRGTWRLVHKPTGEVLDERDDTVLHLPYLSDRGTIMYRGNEYSSVNQSRLKPGVYTRRKKSGEIEAFYNVKQGTGRTFRLWLEPESGVFKVSVGQSNIPFYPLAQALGVNDAELGKAWGPDILRANMQASAPQALSKLYQHFLRSKAEAEISDAGRRDALREAFAKAELDPDVVARTLGVRNAQGITPAMLVRSAQKLLNVSRGEEPPDDRDAPKFSRVLSVEDFIRERIQNDAGRVARSLLFKARRDRSLKRVPVGALNPYVQGYLLGSRLTMPLEETNPLSLLEQMNRITKLGEGGIGDAESITDEARNVNDGQLGFVDPIMGPEGMAIGIDVRAAFNTFKGRDGQMYGEFRDVRNGKTKYLKPEDMDGRVLAYPGEMARPGDTAMAIKDGSMQEVPKAEVDFEVPSFGHMMTANTNLNPMPTSVQAARQFYGAKFWGQYMPQMKGEPPLVDSLMPDGSQTFSQYYGKRIGALTSPVEGQVVKVTDDKVVVRGSDGERHEIELVKNFPFNRLTGISYTAAVKPGDAVDKGGVLAHSNFVDQKSGALALGRNLKAAVIPYRGMSYEDAYVISESAAKKLTTDRLMGFDQDTKHDVRLGKNRYASLFPRTFTAKQLEHIDDDGVAKPGTILQPGDPIILATGPKLLTAEDVQLGRLHKALRNAHTDKATVWEHEYPGEVVDAVMTRSGAKVNVRAAVPVQVGDKLSTRFGLKGVVGCYDDKTEVFTDHGWITWGELDDRFRLACQIDGRAFFAKPDMLAVYDYEGELIHAHSAQLDYCVTPNHRMWCKAERNCKTAAIPEFRICRADEVERRRVVHRCAAEFDWASSQGDVFDLRRHVDYDPGRERKKAAVLFSADDVGEFLGWYLSEGSVSLYVGRGIGAKGRAVRSYKVQLSQSRTANPAKCAAIETLLTRMGVGWHYSGTQYTFGSKPWYLLLKPLGLSGGKRIPAWAWGLPKSALRKLFDAAMAGDGHGITLKTKRPQLIYKSKSRGLCEDMEILATLFGYNATIRPATPDQHAQRWRMICKSGIELGQSSARFERVKYNGRVYCAQVPGGLVYVRRLGRPMWCGNTILPDDKMPRDAASDEPFDVLMNPMGVQSRVAAGQPIELQLAKVAAKTGKPMHIPQMAPEEGWAEWAKKRMEEAGVQEKEKIFDPELGRTLNKPVSTGPVYIMAFHHLSEKKLSDRGSSEAGYTMDELPARGGEENQQAKKMSAMDYTALLSHGATEVIKDAQVIRGARNENFWKALKLGRPLPQPEVPFVYRKFLNLMKAGGINIREQGDTLKLMPMTDADIDKLSKGSVDSSEMVTDDLSPIKGGLFDPGRTGGVVGKQWTHINLASPLPNPVFEEPIRRLLGLRQQDYMDVLAGRKDIGGQTGGEGMKAALAAIDIDREIERQKANIERFRGSNRDNAVKSLGYLTALKKQGVSPADWMLTKVPVLPPVFRPISRLGDVTISADINELYRDVIEMNNAVKGLRGDVPEKDLAEAKERLYGAVTAAFGLGDPITPEGQSKRLSGAIRTIIGDSPKGGFFQSRVISKPMDNVGRSVVTPNPNLDMDSVGLPENAAWSIYSNFVLRRLMRRNVPADLALRMIDKREPQAKEALLQEMSVRPVIVDRAPTWHKFNLLAFRPHLIKGDVMQVSPLITKGFTMDFDGDAVNFHVPVAQKAVDQAYEKMLPSRNLFSLTDLRSVRHSPQQEMALGLFMLTQQPSAKPPVRFRTVEDAKRAYKAGQIDANDPIEIG